LSGFLNKNHKSPTVLNGKTVKKLRIWILGSILKSLMFGSQNNAEFLSLRELTLRILGFWLGGYVKITEI
jgi:hypothetical protein